MPKRSKAPNLADLFPTNPGGTPDLPHELTAATWARVFAITLERLRHANPGWAAITAMQVTTCKLPGRRSDSVFRNRSASSGSRKR